MERGDRMADDEGISELCGWFEAREGSAERNIKALSGEMKYLRRAGNGLTPPAPEPDSWPPQ